MIGRGWLSERMSASTLAASSAVSGWRLRLAKAETRIRAPSSSRMLFVMLVAMNSRTSSGMGVGSRSAFLRRMARRVSRSGGWMSVIRPHLKRLRRRSSRVAMAWGGRSEVRTIWRLAAVELVERVEELLLEPLLVLHELDVVDQQHVDLAVAPLERGRGVGADGVDELVQERLGGDVAHLVGRVVLAHVVAPMAWRRWVLPSPAAP